MLKSEVKVKRKILYFLDFPQSFGGANKVLLTQANIMQKKGWKVFVVIPNDLHGLHACEFDWLCAEYNLKTTTARYPIAACLEEIDIIGAIDVYGVIKCIIEDFRPDLIHSVQLNIAVELAARELGIPHLMNIYQTDLQSFYLNWMQIYPQYHSADSVFFSERWGNGLHIMSKCIRVAYEEKKYLPNKKIEYKDDMINILSVGVLCERKKQLEIIKFVMICKENGYRIKLTIVGNHKTEYGELCRKFVEKNDLQGEVIFCGVVLNIEDYFKCADLYVLASTVESYPGVIVESMANKVPVISTSVAGIPELLKDEENAFLCEGYKCDDIYNAFKRYMEYWRTERMSEIIENAYITYKEQHSYEVIGCQLENYCQWIVSDYHKRCFTGMKIEEIRYKFEQFIYKREMNKVNEALIRQLWYLYHIIPVIEKKNNKKVVIWGAGFWGSIALDWLKLLKDKIELVGFIDVNKHGEYLGYPIVENKKNAITLCATIIVALENELARLDIMNYLEINGKVRNIDYFLVCNGPIRIDGRVE